MGAETKIEWADHTFNPWIGCEKIAPECRDCYAAVYGNRFGVEWGRGKPRKRTSESNWRQPLAWDRAAAKAGVRRRVFCASLADVFDPAVDQSWRDALFALTQQTTNLDWLLLTKRPEWILSLLPPDLHGDPRIWLGTTVGHPDSIGRARELCEVPAPVLFLSCEPLLREVVLPPDVLRDVSWVIAGGESGDTARPMHPDWARSLRDQAVGAGVPFMFKQWGEWEPRSHFEGRIMRDDVPHVRLTVCGCNSSSDLPAHGVPGSFGRHECDLGNDSWMQRAGKKATGRILDGRTWDEVPTP